MNHNRYTYTLDQRLLHGNLEIHRLAGVLLLASNHIKDDCFMLRIGLAFASLELCVICHANGKCAMRKSVELNLYSITAGQIIWIYAIDEILIWCQQHFIVVSAEDGSIEQIKIYRRLPNLLKSFQILPEFLFACRGNDSPRKLH